MNIRTVLFASLLGGTALASSAQDVGQHPAVFAPRQLPGINASTFLVGHPASPRWISGHANHEHPAVVMRREAASRTIDPNTFIVQPPAHAEWKMPETLAAQSVAASSRF
jgi:hypothetical protein